MNHLLKNPADVIWWFFNIYLVRFLHFKYLRASDFVRGIWWRAWGHNPKGDPEFHLSQIKFDAGHMNRHTVHRAVTFLGSALESSQNRRSVATSLYFTVTYKCGYATKVQYDTIWGLYGNKDYFQPIVDWFKAVEHINQDQLLVMVKRLPDGEAMYAKMLADKLLDQE